MLGLAPGCLGHSVVVPAQLMVPMPPCLSFQEAATTPTVYITVQAAFQQGVHFHAGTKVRPWACGTPQLACPFACLPACLIACTGPFDSLTKAEAKRCSFQRWSQLQVMLPRQLLHTHPDQQLHTGDGARWSRRGWHCCHPVCALP